MRGKRNYPDMTNTVIIFDEAVETADLQKLVIDAVAESKARVLVGRRPGVPRQLVDWDGEIIDWVPPNEPVARAVLRRLSGKQARPIIAPIVPDADSDVNGPRGRFCP